MRIKHLLDAVVASILVATFSLDVAAIESPSVDVGVDFYSRYVWRGTDVGSNPSIQPTVAFSDYGFELGAWAAYSLSTDSSANDEIDFWASYARSRDDGAGFSLIVTDYYYPNSGIRFSQSDAHTIELGASVTGPAKFPLTLAGYVNVHNDDGHNTYFQADYPAKSGDVDLDFFVGVAGGSEENPDYYDTDSVAVINMGMSASRPIEVSSSLTLPLTGLLIYNPRIEEAYVVVGVSF